MSIFDLFDDDSAVDNRDREKGALHARQVCSTIMLRASHELLVELVGLKIRTTTSLA